MLKSKLKPTRINWETFCSNFLGVKLYFDLTISTHFRIDGEFLNRSKLLLCRWVPLISPVDNWCIMLPRYGSTSLFLNGVILCRVDGFTWYYTRHAQMYLWICSRLAEKFALADLSASTLLQLTRVTTNPGLPYSCQTSPDISYLHKYTLGYDITSLSLQRQIQFMSVGYPQLCDYRNICIVSRRRWLAV